jgi:Pyridoxamine 5'-phosphate oxidase
VKVARPEPGLTRELIELVHAGVAVTVATRDKDLRPALTRSWGPRVDEDGRTLTLCVIAPPASATRANLEENGVIAIGFSQPTIARALQVKGRAVEVHEPGPAELERAERHLSAFFAEVEAIGLPAELARRLYTPDELVSVRVSIDDVFEQTPGPSAGKRL